MGWLTCLPVAWQPCLHGVVAVCPWGASRVPVGWQPCPRGVRRPHARAALTFRLPSRALRFGRRGEFLPAVLFAVDHRRRRRIAARSGGAGDGLGAVCQRDIAVGMGAAHGGQRAQWGRRGRPVHRALRCPQLSPRAPRSPGPPMPPRPTASTGLKGAAGLIGAPGAARPTGVTEVTGAVGVTGATNVTKTTRLIASPGPPMSPRPPGS